MKIWLMILWSSYALYNFLYYKTFTLFTYCGFAFSLFLIYLFVQSGYSLRRSINELPSVNKIIFLLSLAFGLFGLAINWPGFPEDDLYRILFYDVGQPWPWLSFSYSLITRSMLYVLGFAMGNTILNYFLYSILFLQLCTLIKLEKKSFIAWFLVLLIFTPMANLFILVSHGRDAIAGVLLLIFIIGSLKKIYFPDSLFQLKSWHFFLIAFISFDIRQEGRALILLFPLIYQQLSGFSIKVYIRHLIAFSSAAFIFIALIQPVFKMYVYTPKYKTTVFVNPLSYILFKNGIDSLTEEEKASISKVLDLNLLVKDYSELNINPFHNGAYQEDHSNEEFEKFKLTAINLFLKNKALFFENRLHILKSTLNFNNNAFIYEDAFHHIDSEEFALQLKKYRVRIKEPDKSFFQKKYEEWISATYKNELNLYSLIFGNGGWAIAILVNILFFYKSYLFLSLSAMILLIRLIIVSVFSPAAYMKYINSTLLGSWLLLFILLILILKKIKKS